MPSFFIIGVQKSATSFIHSILSQDKNISLPYRKETHFFSINNKKGLNWYLKMFKSNEYNIRGEVDPSYIFYPNSLLNMKNLIKNPKIIILFRKPIDRAFSHYLMSRKRNYEKLSFNKALLEEEKRLFEDSNLFSFSHHSYMKRGSYSKQIDKCKKVFPNSKYLYIKFDDLLNKILGKPKYKEFGNLLLISSLILITIISRSSSFISLNVKGLSQDEPLQDIIHLFNL